MGGEKEVGGHESAPAVSRGGASMPEHMCVCICVSVHTCVHACRCVGVHMCMRACMCVCTHV